MFCGVKPTPVVEDDVAKRIVADPNPIFVGIKRPMPSSDVRREPRTNHLPIGNPNATIARIVEPSAVGLEVRLKQSERFWIGIRRRILVGSRHSTLRRWCRRRGRSAGDLPGRSRIGGGGHLSRRSGRCSGCREPGLSGSCSTARCRSARPRLSLVGAECRGAKQTQCKREAPPEEAPQLGQPMRTRITKSFAIHANKHGRSPILAQACAAVRGNTRANLSIAGRTRVGRARSAPQGPTSAAPHFAEPSRSLEASRPTLH